MTNHQSQATPRPWRVDPEGRTSVQAKCSWRSGDGYVVLANVYDPEDHAHRTDRTEANAVLIVAAVNAHDPEALARVTAENVRLRAALINTIARLLHSGVPKTKAIVAAIYDGRAALAGTP